MALNATVLWYNRVSGAETNGGGFDPSVSGAGTNYADQNSPQLSLTDLTSTASTTVTSVAAGFTSQMVGNVLRLASATGSPTVDYYMITGYTNASTITLDRTSGTYTLGVAKVGGAHATLVNYSNGGGAASPLIATPLLPGHKVYIRSAGSASDPSIAGTPDYDYSTPGYYWIFPVGSYDFPITFIGLGASEAIPVGNALPAYRPLIKCPGLVWWGNHGDCYWHVKNVKGFASAITWDFLGLLSGANASDASYCIWDSNGNDMTAFHGQATYTSIRNCWIKNTGGGAAGSRPSLYCTSAYYVHWISDNLITDQRGIGIDMTFSIAFVSGNVIANCGSDGIVIDNGFFQQQSLVYNNTLYNCGGHGLNFVAGAYYQRTKTYGNTISKIPAGKYGINMPSTAALNDANMRYIDYNNVYLDGGAGGLYNGISAGAHDTNLDPQFTNPATYDFSVGLNLKAKAIGMQPF